MLEGIIITLLIATIINIGLKKIGMPTILGYILTGGIIKAGFDIYTNGSAEHLQEIAEFGVVFLMFTIGLEFSIEHLKKMKKEVFFYGSLQVILTTAIITYIANHIFGIEIKAAVIIGASLSLASTAIILKIFSETGDTKTTYGKNVVGILIFQDLAVIPILLMISMFSNNEQTVNELLVQTLVSGIALMVIMFFVGKKLLNPFFKYTLATNSQEIFICAIFLIILGSSYLAEHFNFSYSLGAFMAGMIIAETHYKHQVEADLIPFRELLLGLFFVSVGLQLDFKIIAENLFVIIMILPVFMIIKGLIIMLLLYGQRTYNKIKTSLLLCGLGEFGLVILDLGQNKSLLDNETGQILSATIIISLIMTPILINKLNIITTILLKILNKNSQNKTPVILDETEKAIIIGYGRLGKTIAHELANRGIGYTIIEANQQRFEAGRKDNEKIILGNGSHRNILEMVSAQKAETIFISIGNSKKLINICTAIRSISESVNIVLKVNTYEEKKLLKSEFINNTQVIVETEGTAQTMLERAHLIPNED